MASTASSDYSSPPHKPERATSYIRSGSVTEHRRSKKLIIFSSFIIVILLIILQGESLFDNNCEELAANKLQTCPAELSTNEAEKPLICGGDTGFEWTNEMLLWQRTGYHFQPEKNWMNDPNGPLFYKGWYHLFYQYNADSPLWGNITWGHAVSIDLINWLYLPEAMVRDQWYDIGGVWTGSATILSDGRIVMLYTGITKDVAQVQCLAYPANSSDPLLLEWVKDNHNPVITTPPGIEPDDFRDPSTAWLGPDGEKWRITIGSKINKNGFSLVYETSDFINYKLLDGRLHEVPGTGIWECVDFYPVSMTDASGLDTSSNGPNIKHVMKVGFLDTSTECYSLGTYDSINNKWTHDDPESVKGIGLRYDYGKYYASKTFYDQEKNRRILLAWVKESNGEDLDILKGWSGLQAIPRTVVFDQKTGSNILQWPIEEVESLRSESYEFNDVKLNPGSVVPLSIYSTSQLDIIASFEINKELSESIAQDVADYDCSTSGGTANRGALGPFGVLVLADGALSEFTPIYFYPVKGANGKVVTHFCVDALRSSEAPDVEKLVYGSKVPVLDGEKLSIRSLVDHSIVESFAQGGRTVITSRVYPTKAINGASRVFLFNNATGASVTASVKAWKMNYADLRPFPLVK